MATHSSTLAWKIPWTEEATVHGVSKSRTRLSDFTMYFTKYKRYFSPLFSETNPFISIKG